MNELEERFEKAINGRFNILEWQGFHAKPRLALIAGMAIGYRMGMDDVLKKMEEKK